MHRNPEPHGTDSGPELIEKETETAELLSNNAYVSCLAGPLTRSQSSAWRLPVVGWRYHLLLADFFDPPTCRHASVPLCPRGSWKFPSGGGSGEHIVAVLLPVPSALLHTIPSRPSWGEKHTQTINMKLPFGRAGDDTVAPASESPSITDQEKNAGPVDETPAPFLTFRSFMLGAFVSIGGIIFGYDTGQISGFLDMKDYMQRFGQLNDKGEYYFSNVRSGLIVSLVSPHATAW